MLCQSVYGQVSVTELPTIKSQLNSGDPQLQVHVNLSDGYWLQGFAVFKDDCSSNNMSGVSATFVSQFGVGANDVKLLGVTNAAAPANYNNFNSNPLQERVSSVYICADNSIPAKTQSIWFNYLAGGVSIVPSCGGITCDALNSYTISTPGKIRGFSFINTPYMIALQTDYYITADSWSVFVDDDPCSLTQVPPGVIANMNIMVNDAGSTQDLSWLASNTLATAAGNPSLCGTNYSWSYTPTKAFLTFGGTSTLTAQSLSTTDIGTFTINVNVDLYPYDRCTIAFTLVVDCLIDPPVYVPTDVTLEIGINAQPFDMAFSQTNSCGMSATMTSAPSGLSWLSLVSNTASGGTLRINGATIAAKGVYIITITNTLNTQVKSDSLTLTIKDPCEFATFITTPSPFSDKTITVPSVTPIQTSFAVKTNVENTYPSIVCGITALFSTTYLPATVASPFIKYTIDPGLVVLPTDIGIHTVVMEIKSKLYHPTVVPAIFTFTITVVCTVSSFSINTTVINFGYVINSGNVNKSTFQPVMNSDCKWPLSYEVQHYENGVYVDNQDALFNPASWMYTFSFNDPTKIGTVQRYDLKYTIPSLVNPSTGQPWTATKSLSITIQPDCLNTVLQDITLNNMSVLVSQSVTQSFNFQDSTAIYFATPTYCGPRTFTFSGGMPTFLSINAAQTTLTLATNLPSDVNVYTLTFNVKLTNYSAIPSITKTFQVTITCNVLSLTFTTAPANILIEPGITSQPQTKPFAVSQFPACSKTIAFSYSSSPPAYVTLSGITTTSGSVSVGGTVASQEAITTVTLRAAADGVISDKSFTVTIQNPCQRIILQGSTPSPLVGMTLIRDFDSTKTQTYSINYDIKATIPGCNIACTPVSFPAYVSMIGTTITVNAALTLSSDVGAKTIKINCTSLDYPTLVTARNYQFVLQINHCTVNTFTIAAIGNKTMQVNDPLVLWPFTAAIMSSDSCLYTITYSSTYVLNSATIAQPAFISFDSATYTFSFNPTLPAHVGVFAITVKASIPDPATGAAAIKTVSTSFTLTVNTDCGLTTLVGMSINNMVINVSQSATQNVAFTNTRSNFYSTPTYCGTRKFVFTPALPTSYLTMDAALSTLTLSTNNVATVGTYTITFDVSLQDYPAVPKLTYTFQVIINCLVYTLSYSTPPPVNLLIEPGVTTQPFSTGFASSQIPNCGRAVTFVLVSGSPSFLSLTNLMAFTGSIMVNGVTLSNLGNHPVTLRASVDGQVTNVSFNIEIADPCRRAVFQSVTPSPLTNMILIRTFDTTKTQTFSISTDILTSFGVSCAYSVALVTPPIYVSLAGLTITVSESLTTSADAGLKTISVKATSVNFPGTVASRTYTFTLDIQHCVVSTFTIPTITAVTHVVNQGLASNTFSPAVQSSLACLYVPTYTDAYVLSGSSISRPSWVTFNGATRTISFNSIQLADVGIYTITVTATIPQLSLGPGGTKIISTSFQLIVVNDCLDTIINDKVINAMSTKVSLSVTQDITFTDTKAILFSTPTYCGPRVITFSGGQPAYLQVDSPPTTLTLSTNNVADVGIYTVTFTVSLQLYPTVTPVSKTFQVLIACEAFTVTFSTPPANLLIEPQVTTQPYVKTFITSQSPSCGHTVTFIFVSVPPAFVTFQNLAPAQGDIKVNGATLASQGLHSITIRASVDATSVDKTFTVEISDPCKRAIFQPSTPSPLADMSFMLDFDTADLTQLFAINTDIKISHSIVCAYNTNLVAPPVFASLSGTTLSIIAASILPTHVGPNYITIRVTSALFPLSVFAVNYQLKFTVSFCSTSVFTIPAIPNMDFIIGQGATDHSYTDATFSNLACLYTVTHTASYELLGSIISMPSFVTFIPISSKFTVNSLLPADLGVYTVTVTATIPQPSLAAGTLSVTSSFLLTIGKDCFTTTWIDHAFNVGGAGKAAAAQTAQAAAKSPPTTSFKALHRSWLPRFPSLAERTSSSRIG